MSQLKHTPVLVNEVIGNFSPHGEDRLLDATLGLGGHMAAYLKAGGEKTTAVGIELDKAALEQAKMNLEP
ncbi:MAG: 16S rRNA (cytosine(1402)-N(4))-methyltransferase, partial [Candidatus Andersenbacteria bacterium]|nr:16S rRNA (cytosine(1402)-N(4))-methyltransferase [Candidatus Andersenbacteria bacterium]